jgi:hypothetical protein
MQWLAGVFLFDESYSSSCEGSQPLVIFHRLPPMSYVLTIVNGRGLGTRFLVKGFVLARDTGVTSATGLTCHCSQNHNDWKGESGCSIRP